ncbi:MAG: protein kinase [Bradymonadales bacterium]|nr:protein kinase [Bradymonadales bacterium]
MEGWPVDPIVGALFADTYTVMKRLGRGGFGVVYLAENREFGGQRALKVLHGQHVHNDNILRRFKREAKALYRLQSPYTVRMERWGRTESGQYYMVMEFAQGETLRRILEQEGRLAEPRALNIARQIAVALADANALDILHRDLKPENIVVRSHTYEGDRIAVLDFGIAKILSDETDSRISGLIGTPSYMAPENWRPSLGPADIRSDLWSLGVILYEMLVGTLPFGPKSTSDPIAMAYQAVNLKPKAIAAALASVSAHPLTQQMVIRLLQPAPDNRYPNPAQLLSVLEDHPCLHGRISSEIASPAKREQPDSDLEPLALADTVGFSPRSEAAGLSAEGEEEFSFDGQPPDETLIFQDEPPEDLKIPSRSTQPTPIPEEAPPQRRVKTLVFALVLLGALFLLARFGDRLLTWGSHGPPERDAGEQQVPGDQEDTLPDATTATRLGTDGMLLVEISGGTFAMGSDQIPSASPSHNATLSPFALDAAEVTVSRWLHCVQVGACPPEEAVWAPDQPGCPQPDSHGTAGDRPMTCVSWIGADAYCAAQGRLLVTEAQWELAARGSSIQPADAQPGGPDTASGTDQPRVLPASPGSRVREWVHDWWSAGYYQSAPPFDPSGPVLGTERVVRGGLTSDERPRDPAERDHLDPRSKLPDLGFRCVDPR